MLPPNNRKGSGFTNINRVINANQGNKLGQNVTSGVQNQSNQVKSNVQQATTNFNEEAQKNRLDTEENKNKVNDVVGRFGDENTTSSGVSTAVQGTQDVANQVANNSQIGANNGLVQERTSTANLAKSQPTRLNQVTGKMESNPDFVDYIPSPSERVGHHPPPTNSIGARNGLVTAPTGSPDLSKYGFNSTRSKFYVDEANFKLNSDMQNEYDRQKQATNNQLSQYQAEVLANNARIQERLKNDQAGAERALAAKSTMGSWDASRRSGNVLNGYVSTEEDIKTRQAAQQQDMYQTSVVALKKLQETYNKTSPEQESQLRSKLASIESQYGDLTASEKNKWIQSERDKLIAANLPTEQEINDFAKYRTGIYDGPKQLADYQSLAGKAADTEMLGDLTRSQGGRQEILKRFVGGNGYTQGQQGLDNLLLGQDPTALNQARRATQGLSADVNSANSQASGLATEFANRARIFGEETTQKLNNARTPVDAKINTQLEALKSREAQTGNNVTEIQSMLNGTSNNTKGLDRIARLGVGLQSAKDAGYLNDAQASQLLGDGGLIQRAEALGLDTSKLLNDRIFNNAGKNLNRGGAASSAQEAQLTALDRLLGKQGTDVEFGQAGADYEDRTAGFNLDSFKDYVSKAEKEKYGNNPAKIAEMEKYNARYMDQVGGGIQNYAAGITQQGGAGLNQALNPESWINPTKAQGNAIDAARGISSAAIGGQRAVSQGSNAILEGLAKLNVGGNSISNTEGGKQLLKALELKSKMENGVLDGAGAYANGMLGGISDLSKGNVGGALTKYLQTPGNVLKASGIGGGINNVGKAIGTALGGGKTGNWSIDENGTVNSETGKRQYYGDFKNMSSDAILKQMLSQQQLDMTDDLAKKGKIKHIGAEGMNALNRYYQAALDREKKNK